MQGQDIPFDRYLDIIFAGPNRTDACLSMLSEFLECIDGCRDNLNEMLPDIAPGIVEQSEAVSARAREFEAHLRSETERHGPEFKTCQLGAALWWAGMASHKATAAGRGS